ncbi:hypothetical protein TWF506_007347 [Arthrobotrys conoides]|uniref:Uncharacterized protein n=1 Tax=Arthrobotrys conoides TaxID=74498 RepID=A0AAN8PHH0_9PEZI
MYWKAVWIVLTAIGYLVSGRLAQTTLVTVLSASGVENHNVIVNRLVVRTNVVTTIQEQDQTSTSTSETQSSSTSPGGRPVAKPAVPSFIMTAVLPEPTFDIVTQSRAPPTPSPVPSPTPTMKSPDPPSETKTIGPTNITPPAPSDEPKSSKVPTGFPVWSFMVLLPALISMAGVVLTANCVKLRKKRVRELVLIPEPPIQTMGVIHTEKPMPPENAWALAYQYKNPTVAITSFP